MRRALIILVAVVYFAGVAVAAAYVHDCHRIRVGFVTMDTGPASYAKVPRNICATP